MTILAFVAVSISAGVASILLRANQRWSGTAAIAGLLVAFGIALGLSDGDAVRVAETALAGSEFSRLFLALGALSGLLITLLAATTSWIALLPGTWLITLGGLALTLGFRDSATAAAAATACGLVGILVTVGPQLGDAGLAVGRRELRALTVAGVLALVAIGVVGSQAAIGLDPSIVGLAYLGFVAAVAMRMGSIPFHLWVARSSDTAPPIALPLVLAWAPAVFVIVALAWMVGSVQPLAEPLLVERVLIVVVAGLTVVLGATAAAVNPDLEHVVGYSIVSDGAFALLALAVLDPAAWAATRAWLLAFVLAKTAFAAWVAALHYSFGARQLIQLDGWARRSPLLALGLLGVVVAGVGAPGMAVFEARSTIAALAVAGPPAALLVILPFASLAYYGRLAVVGLSRPSIAVASGPEAMPRWPAGRRPRTAREVADDVAVGLRANRAPIAAALVMALSVLAVAVAAGGLGARSAAASGRPQSSPVNVESGAQ